ncbi:MULTISPECIES: hypothetical protein [unclassified Streptomyces]|uniref:hypothetical protein n=1 Tax=unclassified Streptomyces TaxID=2593676 RepID=UPI000ADB6D6A|nr:MULTISPECIES: hypothetical protein [unclassified Streptomyces]
MRTRLTWRRSSGHRAVQQAWLTAEPGQLVRAVEEGEDRMGQEEGGGCDAGADEQEDHRDQFVLGERLTAVAALLDQCGDQVVGGLGPAPGDQFPDVVDDADQPVHRPAAVAVREVVDPGAHAVPVGGVDADELADDDGGQGVGELAQQVRLVLAREGGQQVLGHPFHERAQRRDPAGGERPGERDAQSGVLFAVEQGQMPGDVLGVIGGEAGEGRLQQFRLRVGAAGPAGDLGAVPDQPGLGQCGLDVGMARDEPDRGLQTREHHLREPLLGAELRVGAHGVLDEFGSQVDRAGSGGRGGGVV